MRIKFTPSAERELLAAIEYIGSENTTAAWSFRERAWKSLERLRDFPESGRRIPEFPDLPHREVIVAPYRFFYRIENDIAWIVSVWHDAQLPLEPQK